MSMIIIYKWVEDHDAAQYVRDFVNNDAEIAERYLIASDNDVIIGLIGARTKSHYVVELKHLHVKVQYRGKGIGKELLRRATLETVHSIKISTIRQSNLHNFFINLKLGWKLVGIQPSPYSDNKLFIMCKLKEVTDE